MKASPFVELLLSHPAEVLKHLMASFGWVPRVA